MPPIAIVAKSIFLNIFNTEQILTDQIVSDADQKVPDNVLISHVVPPPFHPKYKFYFFNCFHLFCFFIDESKLFQYHILVESEELSVESALSGRTDFDGGGEVKWSGPRERIRWSASAGRSRHTE